MFYKKRFLTTEAVLSALRNAPKVVLPSIPPDLKENTMFIVDNKTNAERKSEGKKSVFFSMSGACHKRYFVMDSDMN